MLTDENSNRPGRQYFFPNLTAMQMAEQPSEAVVAERVRVYLCDRLTELTRVLSEVSSMLAEG